MFTCWPQLLKGWINTYPLGISLFLFLVRRYKAPSILRRKNSKTHSTPDRFKIKTMTVLLGFVSRETRTRIVHGYRDIQPRSQGFSLEGGRERDCVASLISKSSIFKKCFPSKLKRKAGVFKFLWFEERFRKAPRRVSKDGRPNHRNEAVSFHFCRVV